MECKISYPVLLDKRTTKGCWILLASTNISRNWGNQILFGRKTSNRGICRAYSCSNRTLSKDRKLNMTEKRARALHRAMWFWLAKHPGSYKEDWPGWKNRRKKEEIMDAYCNNICFACYMSVNGCNGCPIAKKAGICSEFCPSSLWKKYTAMQKTKKFTPSQWETLCEQIANAWPKRNIIIVNIYRFFRWLNRL